MSWLILVGILLVFIMVKNSKVVAADKYVFSLHNTIDNATEEFGVLCEKVCKAVPESKRDGLAMKVVVDRTNITATFTISSQQVDLTKVIPGYRLIEARGWNYGQSFLEGKVTNIDLPAAWDGPSMPAAIIRDFKKGFPSAVVANQFDDILDTKTVGVIFKAY